MFPNGTDDKKRPKMRRRNAKHSSGGVDVFLKKKEQLEAAQTRLIRAQQRMDRIRTKIRSKGGFEPDSLLFLSDGADNDLLSYIMGFLTVEELVRSEMVCRTLRQSAKHSWEELGKRSDGAVSNGIRQLHRSTHSSREIVIRNHLASTYDEEEFDDEVLDADDLYEPPPQTAGDHHVNRQGIQNGHGVQYSYVSSGENKAPSFSKRYAWHMELSSTFLFLLGSLLYLVCSIHDYEWSQTLLEVPEWLREVDDDAAWMRYRLEEQYGNVSSNAAGVRGFSGGARRRFARDQLPWVRNDDDVYYNKYNKNNAFGQQQHRNVPLQTPEGLYYDLDWASLPLEIRDAYAILGYTETAWDTGQEVKSNRLNWEELTPEMRNAALLIGYTEMIWSGFYELDELFATMRHAGQERNSTTLQNPLTGHTINATSPHTVRTPAIDNLAPSSYPSNSDKFNQFPVNPHYVTVRPSTSPSKNPSLQTTSSFQPAHSVTPIRNTVPTPPPTMKFWMLGSPFAPPSASPTVRQTEKPSYSPTDLTSSSPSVYPSRITALVTSIPSEAPSPNQSMILPESSTKIPGELYEDESWGDLPPKIQDAYKVLGYNETSWNESILLPSERMTWIELSPAMQEAASFIGYTQQTWDIEVEILANTSYTISSDNTGSNYYEDYEWNVLPPDVKEAATILGYDQSTWDHGGATWSNSKYWNELPPIAQDAASLFGFNEASWNAKEDSYFEALLKAAGGEYFSNDDDYVFRLQDSGVRVSEYQILYFFASLCFIFTGVFAIARENFPFHALMVLAGIFGVASAVYVEANVHLSNVMDTVSVHLFLLQGVILLLQTCKQGSPDEEKLAKRLIIFARSEFVVGAILDLMLSYFYLFDKTADWDTALSITWVFSRVLWLHCSLICMGVFVYNTIQQTKEAD